MTNSPACTKLKLMDVERKRFVASAWENHMRDLSGLRLNGDIGKLSRISFRYIIIFNLNGKMRIYDESN